MDTRQLNYILTIAECGSISKAANKLFISQSGLNQQLQRISPTLPSMTSLIMAYICFSRFKVSLA